MPIASRILIGTGAGCLVFDGGGKEQTELEGRYVYSLARGPDGTVFAIVDDHEIWCRTLAGEWSMVVRAAFGVESIVMVRGVMYIGASDAAAMYRLTHDRRLERLEGFDCVRGREEWFQEGPPLCVRSLSATADGSVVLAAVHVGGIARSTDCGQSWEPTLPVRFDVHEVRTHSSLPFAAAAAAVGLCVSEDSGKTWTVISEGLETTYSLALCVLQDEVLFSIQDGPFPQRSQIWRWSRSGGPAERVRHGLPEWLQGKVDTNHIFARENCVALVDAGGDVWLSSNGSRQWRLIGMGIAEPLAAILLSYPGAHESAVGLFLPHWRVEHETNDSSPNVSRRAAHRSGPDGSRIS